METSLLNAVVIIAAGASVIKFALFEWEGIAQAWRRVRHIEKRKPNSRRKRVGAPKGRCQ
jgi:hypothetical protein